MQPMMQYTLPIQQQQPAAQPPAAAQPAPPQLLAAAAAAPLPPQPAAAVGALQQPAAAAAAAVAAPAGDSRLEKCGFAKLLGDNGLEYYIKKYEIVLGRKSKAQVDVVLGDSPVLSRHHAKIVYNFAAKHWELVVEGKNGVTVNGQLYTPMSPPCVLQSQDLLQAGDHNFYFLLPKQTRKRGPNKPKNPAAAAAAVGESGQQQQQQGQLQQQPAGLSSPVAAAAGQQQQLQSPALPGVSPAAAAAIPAPTGPPGLRSSFSGPLLPDMPPGSSLQAGLGNGTTAGGLQLQQRGLGFGPSGGLGFGDALPSLPSGSMYGSGVLAPGETGVLEEFGQGDEIEAE